ATTPIARTAVGVAAIGSPTTTPAIAAAATARPRRGPPSASSHGARANAAPTTIAPTDKAIASFSPTLPHARLSAQASPSATRAPACNAARRVGPTVLLYLLYRTRDCRRRQPESATARGGPASGRAPIDSRRRRLGQDARHHLPHHRAAPPRRL